VNRNEIIGGSMNFIVDTDGLNLRSEPSAASRRNILALLYRLHPILLMTVTIEGAESGVLAEHGFGVKIEKVY
jgi:hypothetical protein